MTEKIEIKKVNVENKALLDLSIKREEGKVKLSIKVAEEIENLYKQTEQKESGKYQLNGAGLMFYAWNNDNRTADIMEDIALNDYGKAFVFENSFNFSVLRTVNISEGITVEITNLVSEEALVEWCKKLKEFVVKLYKNYLKPCEITVLIQTKEVC